MREELPSSGSLADFPIVSLMGRVFRRGDTGTLRLFWNGLGKTFWFRAGSVVAAVSDLEGEHLLDFLLPDYKDSLLMYDEVWRELPLPTVMERCRTVAGIPEARIRQALEASVYLNVGSALSWYGGEFAWSSTEPPEFPCGLRLSIPVVLWKVLQGVRDVETLWKQVRSPGNRIRIRPEIFMEGRDLTLTPQDAYFIQQMDGRTHLEHARQVSGLSPTRAMQIACLAVACGWADLEAPAEPERQARSAAGAPAVGDVLLQTALYRQKVLNFYKNLPHVSPAQLLMVTPQTVRSELEANYRRLLDEYDPERCLRDPALRDLHAVVAAIRDAVQRAYEQVAPNVPAEPAPSVPASTPAEGWDLRNLRYWKLRDSVSTERPGSSSGVPTSRSVPKTPQEVARLLRLQALDYIQSGENWQAARALENAIRVQPHDAELHFLLGTVYEKHPRLHARAVQAYLKAVELEPDNVRYLAHLAFLLYQDGQWRRAARYLERLVALDPLDGKAHQLLAEVRQRLAQGPGAEDA